MGCALSLRHLLLFFFVVDFTTVDGVSISLNGRIVLESGGGNQRNMKDTISCEFNAYHFPAASRENVLVVLVPTALYNFAWVRLRAICIAQHSTL